MQVMKICITYCLLILMLLSGSGKAQIVGDRVTCYNRNSKCFLKRGIRCPSECPSLFPTNPNSRSCYLNCASPICKPECRIRKPNCNGFGAACFDPRFIGGDGVVFYFHGRSNEHFTLVSDQRLQVNARFIGLRPTGRTRDSTWIQALGFLFDSHVFSVGAIKSTKWDDEVDHFKFTYKGSELVIPDGYLNLWESPESDVKIERVSEKNSVLVTLREIAEISVSVVPVTEEDDRIHNYQIPEDDCFAHLEVQFRFFGLSPEVEGVLGRTYQPEFKNPAKPGVAMAVVGGEDKYRTESLFSKECISCIFSKAKAFNGRENM